jgi:hypothetical protein
MSESDFLSESWQECDLKRTKEIAGKRYTPEYNVELPIADVFNGISRTENFYTEIRENYGRLRRNFLSLPKEYNNVDLRSGYEKIKNEISGLLIILDEIKQFNTKEIPWREIKNKTDLSLEYISNFFIRLTEKDHEDKKGESEKVMTIKFIRYHTIELQKTLYYFSELSRSVKSKLTNLPFLLITGKSGVGKTHLLCDVMEHRIKEKNLSPMIVTFGEQFISGIDPIIQIMQQINISGDKKYFLKQLNDYGEKIKCRVILAIDALNETKDVIFWKNHLKELVTNIKKYPNIALILSVRSGFEDQVIPEQVKDTFVIEEHMGFKFKEREAIEIIFNEFNIPIPEIPILIPEFQNPLFLIFFCKAFKCRTRKLKNKQTIRGHEGATYIFENFVKKISNEIIKKFDIGNNASTIWRNIIKKMALIMVDQNSDIISEDQLVCLVKKEYPNIDCNEFIKSLENNTLIVKVPNYSFGRDKYKKINFRFPFQKFSDHLIARSILNKYEDEVGKINKNFESAKKFFSRRRRLGKFIENPKNRGIIEALSVQCPEHLHGTELVYVAPYLKDSEMAQEAFIQSLIWRKPTAFSKKLLKDKKSACAYIKDKIIDNKLNELLDALLIVASLPEHPLNADFLHNYLLNFSMPERDSIWSNFLLNQDGKGMSVDRLIEWGWSEQDKLYINKESIRLCAVTLCWFFTTSNRVLRDKATKSLIALLTNRLDIVLTLFEKFKNIDDFYVSERLYAVGYGCAIRSYEDEDNLKSLSEWIYKNVFQSKDSINHILLRDYAIGIISFALNKEVDLQIDKDKIESVFHSEWINNIPSYISIKEKYYSKEKTEEPGLRYIWMSIMYSTSDFCNHVLERVSNMWYMSNLNTDEDKKINNALKTFDKNLIQRWIFSRVMELGWSCNLHGEIDEFIWHNFHDRSSHKVERLGKKYQWIALHEILALISDNFKFRSEWDDEDSVYMGAWQLGLRDIDPSCILKEFPNKKPTDVPTFKNHFCQGNELKNTDLNSSWILDDQDLPCCTKVIEFSDIEEKEWLLLEGYIEYLENLPPEHRKYELPTRRLYYMIKSYLVDNERKDEIIKWIKSQNLWGRWMPESHEFEDSYLGEYPWSPYFFDNEWIDQIGGKKIPGKILVTSNRYMKSSSSLDCSINNTMHIYLPERLIVKKMSLSQKYIDGRFFDKENELVAFDPSVFDNSMPECLLVRKDMLVRFLRENNYSIIWTIVGEKNVIKMKDMALSDMSKITGVYTLNRHNRIIGDKLNLE